MIPMPKEDTTSRTKRRKKETTLREAVVRHVEEFSVLNGLEAAMKEFERMEVMFSGNRDWPDIEKEVKAFFLKKKRLEQEAVGEREHKINQALLDALASGTIANQLNLLLGNNPQAPYYSSTQTTTGGRK
jgi:hypothetical protein